MTYICDDKELMELDEEYIEYDDWAEDTSDKEYTHEEIEFAFDFYDFIQDLIFTEDSINEEFLTQENLLVHYRNHCLHGNKKLKSVRTHIYYDFETVDEYSSYEKQILSKFNSSSLIINSLYEKDKVIKLTRKLFEGGKCLVFTPSCGFVDESGQQVYLGIYAFSTDKTTNYSKNTVSLIVVKLNKIHTKTIYSIDANYLETKLNNIIKKHTNPKQDVEIKFNH